MQTGDIQLLKNINARLVLNLIRENQPISGADLAKITGMRPSTISSLLKELDSKSLILNRGKGKSTLKGGKRPTLWSLNKDVGYVIGIDLEINQAISVLLDLEGNIIHKNSYSWKSDGNLEGLTDFIQEVVDELLKAKNISYDSILGLGVGVTGIVDAIRGIVVTTTILPHPNIPLADMLMEQFDFPVFVENNANAAAMGEKWLGMGKDVDNFMVAVVEFDRQLGGLGIGLVLRKELFHGVAFAAGEPNFSMPVLESELRPLQNRFPEGSILKDYTDRFDDVTIKVLIDAAQKGDEIAITFFNRIGHTIGLGVAAAIAILNPQKLIIDGDIAELGDLITVPIKSAINVMVHNLTSSSLQVVTGIHGRYSMCIGAASIILNDIFKTPLVTSNSMDTYF